MTVSLMKFNKFNEFSLPKYCLFYIFNGNGSILTFILFVRTRIDRHRHVKIYFLIKAATVPC